MAPALHRFAEFLRDLQGLERAAVARGEGLLDSFLRHTASDSGALYLREGTGMKLAAKSGQCVAPEILDCEPPADVSAEGDFILVPLRNGRDHFGVVRLMAGDTHTDDDMEMLRTAAAFASAVLTNQRLTQEMRDGDFQLKYRLWELESLYDIGLSIASTLNTDDLADEVLSRMISLTNARRASLFLREGKTFAPYRSFGDIALPQEALTRLETEVEPVLMEEGSVVAVPIKGNNEVIGVLVVAERETRDGGVGAFESNDLRMLTQFANQVGIALENARLHKEALQKQAMQREFELAATIQRDILPKSVPKVEGIELAVMARPARQVGGDYHAFIEHENGVTIVVADVAGKSMPAALLVSALHAATQLLFAEGRELGEIATELNKHIHRWSAENKFVTMVLVSIDRENETMQFVNAGHNPCYVLCDGKLDLLRSHGLPIGILAQSKYMTQTRPFPAGSAVILYSDGITEAENEAGEEYENPRLEDLLQANLTASAAELRDLIAKDVDTFVGAAAQKDDQTLVVART